LKTLLKGIALMMPLLLIVAGVVTFLWTQEEAGGREVLLFLAQVCLVMAVFMVSLWLFSAGVSTIRYALQKDNYSAYIPPPTKRNSKNIWKNVYPAASGLTWSTP